MSGDDRGRVVASGTGPVGRRASTGAGGRREVRRGEVLEAARAVFRDLGYHRAFMDAIAERCGVSKPAVYSHFPSKMALYLVVVEQAATEMVTAVRSAVAAHVDDDGGWTRTAIGCYVDLVCAPGGVEQLLLDVDVRECPEVAEVVSRATADCVDALSASLVRERSLPDVDARLLAAGLIGLATSTARHLLVSDSPDRDDAVDLSARLAWRGIGGFHPSVEDPGTGTPAPTEPGRVDDHGLFERLTYVLDELSFPAQRWEVLAAAEMYGADRITLRMLHGLVGTRFRDLREVVADLRERSEPGTLPAGTGARRDDAVRH